MAKPTIYVIGSLRNPRILEVGSHLRGAGWDVFEEWYSAGEKADDAWQAYETARGHTFAEALRGYPAQHVFNFDKHHLDRCDNALLVLPAGKSGHLELGYAIGSGKKGYILLDKEPERYDVMYAFATRVFSSLDAFIAATQLSRNAGI